MRFELLRGIHQDEHGRTYIAPRPGTDGPLPIVVSDRDLVACFGKERFRRLTDADEGSAFMGDMGAGNPTASAPISDTSMEPAEGEDDTYGDVTTQFPKAQKKGLRVYRNMDGKYVVASEAGRSEPLKSRIAVHAHVKNFK